MASAWMPNKLLSVSPVTLPSTPLTAFAGWPAAHPQACKGGEQSFRNPQRHFTENKYNRGDSSSQAAEVTPSVGFPQSLPVKEGAGFASAPWGAGPRPAVLPQTLPVGATVQLTLLKVLFTCSTTLLLFSQGRKRCWEGKEKVSTIPAHWGTRWWQEEGIRLVLDASTSRHPMSHPSPAEEKEHSPGEERAACMGGLHAHPALGASSCYSTLS